MLPLESRTEPLLTLGFELREEAVPTSIDGTWFNMGFTSFGMESMVFKTTQATDFITDKLKQTKLVPPELNFKLFYLAPLPAAITTEGIHMNSVDGFTNIDKQRIELNIFPPRDYAKIFKPLVHEIIHMCLLEKSKQKEATAVETEVETYTDRFFYRFSKEYTLPEKPMLEDPRQTIDKELSTFSKADTYLLTIVNVPKSQSVLNTFFDLKNAVLEESVKLEPVS